MSTPDPSKQISGLSGVAVIYLPALYTVSEHFLCTRPLGAVDTEMIRETTPQRRTRRRAGHSPRATEMPMGRWPQQLAGTLTRSLASTVKGLKGPRSPCSCETSRGGPRGFRKGNAITQKALVCEGLNRGGRAWRLRKQLRGCGPLGRGARPR